MKIYKKHVLEALETEPLEFGSWCSVADEADCESAKGPANKVECTVCAVGSVFRKFTKRSASNIRDTLNIMVIDDGNVMGRKVCVGRGGLPKTWLNAISFVWESLSPYRQQDVGHKWQEGVEDARSCMLEWVENNVPEETVLWTM